MKKNALIFIISLICLSMLSACNKPTANDEGGDGRVTADAEGHCTDQVLNLSNEIADSSEAASATPDRGHLLAAANSCQKLKTLIHDQTCLVLDNETGKFRDIRYALFADGCEKLINYSTAHTKDYKSLNQ